MTVAFCDVRLGCLGVHDSLVFVGVAWHARAASGTVAQVSRRAVGMSWCRAGCGLVSVGQVCGTRGARLDWCHVTTAVAVGRGERR